jgi:hypothetical protein
MVLSYLAFESMRLVVNFIFRKYDREPDVMAILYLIIINLAATSMIVTLGVNIYFRFILGFSAWSTFSAELGIFLAVFIFTSLFYSSIAVSTSYLYRENRNQMLQEQILKENLELELTRFKNEINPDLLYDSLESLIPLIHNNAEKAEDHIDRMALVYRYILSCRNSDLVDIKKELKAVRNLVSLLNEKYSNNIVLDNNIDSDFNDRMVIPGSLSSTVETIVRSTIISNYQPLNLQLEASEDEYLVISHPLNEKLKPIHTDGYTQLQRAYSIYTEKPVVSVKAYGENFVKIPLLQLKEELV